MSIDDPVVRKNNPRSKPLNGLISASICVRKFVSANNAPAKKAPSCGRGKKSLNRNGTYISRVLLCDKSCQTVSLKPNF